MDEEEEIQRRVVDLMPMLRVYLSAFDPVIGDQIRIEDLKDWISQEGPAETIKKLIDGGVLNVVLCCWDDYEILI